MKRWLPYVLSSVMLVFLPSTAGAAITSCALDGLYVGGAAVDAPPTDQFQGTFNFKCTDSINGTLTLSGTLLQYDNPNPIPIDATVFPYQVNSDGVLTIYISPDLIISGMLGHLSDNVANSFVYTASASTNPEIRFSGVAVRRDLAASAGSASSEGPQGATGPQGAKGATGPAGLQGATGAQGAQGLAGSQGPAGPLGAAGPRGSSGATGLVGPQGPQGDPGPAGATGSVGMTFRGDWLGSASYVVNDVVTHTGETWIALVSNTNVQPPTDAAKWLKLAAKGDPGPTGLTGATGPAGPQGLQGNPGPAGAAGPAGATGAAGPSGQLIGGGTGNQLTTGGGSAEFMGLFEFGVSTTESDVDSVFPLGGTILGFEGFAEISPGGGNSWTLTLRVAGTDTLSCTISQPATRCEDTTAPTSTSIAAGNLVSVRIDGMSNPDDARMHWRARVTVP